MRNSECEVRNPKKKNDANANGSLLRISHSAFRIRGVTLLEMLVVLTLVGLLAAVVAPSVGAGLETVRLRSSAERLAASLKLARDRAVRSRHYVEVTLNPSSRRVAIQDREGDFERSWDLAETIAVKEEATARREAPPPPEHIFAFMFSPDGATPAVALRLENNRGRAVDVEMDPLTAFPKVVDPAREER